MIVDPDQWRGALERVAASALAAGARVGGLCRSPLHGADGNVEFLLLLRPDPAAGERRVGERRVGDPAADELPDDVAAMIELAVDDPAEVA